MPLKADGTVEFRATLFAVIREVVHSYFLKILSSIFINIKRSSCNFDIVDLCNYILQLTKLIEKYFQA
jgi:hypothetical protein